MLTGKLDDRQTGLGFGGVYSKASLGAGFGGVPGYSEPMSTVDPNMSGAPIPGPVVSVAAPIVSIESAPNMSTSEVSQAISEGIGSGFSDVMSDANWQTGGQ